MPGKGPIFNPILIAALVAWLIAQTLKLPIHYFIHRRWNWGLLVSTGGMPSSHSALVTSTALATGLFAGFNSPEFAIAVALAMVVVYDAAGIRRQAGYHAQKINIIIEEMFSGQAISDAQLKEVLGHTPFEVLGGSLLGFAVALIAKLVLG